MHRRALLRRSVGALAMLAVGCRPSPQAPGSSPAEPRPGARGPRRDPPQPPASAAPRGADPAPRQDPTGDPQAGGPEPPSADGAAPRPRRTVPVICRDALGLAGAAAGAQPHTISRVTLHHTGVPLDGADGRVPARLRAHQASHQARGWADVAYHLAVDRSGHVYELRDVGSAGDTATDYDPTGHLLIVCEGDYGRDEPSEVQLERLAELVAHAAQRHGVPVGSLSGHRDHAATACPGDALQARLAELRTRAGALADEVDVVLEAVCGDAGRDRVRAIEATA